MSKLDQASTASENLQTSAYKSKLIRLVLKGLPTILVLAAMGGGWMVMHHVNSIKSTTVEVGYVEIGTETDILRLPEGKLNTGSFESIPAQSRELQHVHTVPGRLRYDQTKRVNVKAPMDGILTELCVAPGDHVACGDLIAIVRSPEIGKARAEILRGQKELVLATQILEREQALERNLKAVSVMLDQGQTTNQIEEVMSDLALGTYRQDILSAYSKMRLAEELIVKVKPLAEEGIIAGRVVREREAERQLAETAFRTARDQANFSVEQSKLKAEAAASEVERQLNLAWQSLETLLGYKENKETANLSNEEALSRLEVRAPFDGSVESRAFANSERVMRGDSLIVLANTDSLSVEASIRESDWSAVELGPGTEIAVIVPALGDRKLSAKVRYFGREVQADTNAIPLVARIDNSDGLLRPGMFVRVAVPIGQSRQALSIKPESILQHENQEFVFVELSGGEFKKVNVTTGQTFDDWVEVTQGLSQGQLVVTNGTFLLKSELLLQGEGD
jgi:membrane fusion protein, heavy metal efflux system